MFILLLFTLPEFSMIFWSNSLNSLAWLWNFLREASKSFFHLLIVVSILLFFNQADEVGIPSAVDVEDCVVATVVVVPLGKLMVLAGVCKVVCEVGLNWDVMDDDVEVRKKADVDCGIIEGGFVADIDVAVVEAITYNIIT